MSTLDERDRLREFVFSAVDADEVRAAIDTVKRHVEEHPEDRDKDLVHGFYYTVLDLREREKQAEALGLTPELFAEREAVRKAAVVAAKGEQEDPAYSARLEEAGQGVRAWAERFPADPLPAQLLDFLAHKEGEAQLTREVMRYLREEPELTEAPR